jgi:hypothetical protein
MTKHLALVTFILLLYSIVNAQNSSTSIPKKPATGEVNEPILVVTGKDNGTVDEWSMWFKGNGTSVYRLCTHMDEPIWGATPPYGQANMSSEELFRIRGSVLNLKVWEQLQFYVASLSASVVGSDENSAETYTIGDGLFETVYKYPGGGNTTSDKPPRSSSELPPSAFAHAVLTRTAAGAKLEIDGIPSARCGEESLNINSTSPIIKINISNAELANWAKLEKTVAVKGPGSDGNGTYAYEVTVTATLPDVGVEIIGCTEIGAGEESVVTAKAAKEGGTYRFWAEPQEMFSIEANGSSATLRGSSPGRGTLYVEYTSADGNKTEAKKEALCVSVETYNDGQIIPQIPLFDIDGKKLDGILNVPVEIKPNDAADLLSYIPANPAVLTAVGLGDVVTIQGILPGKTTIQATTNCGATTGPAVEVEVVNCDDETIATLERMKKAALENLVEATKEMQRAAGSPEFEKARDELVSSTVELLAKAGLTIISNGKTSGAVETAAKIAEAGSAVSEMIASADKGEFYTNAGKAASGEIFDKAVYTYFGEKMGDLWGKSLSAAIGVVEVGQAAKKFGDNIGEILKHDDVMKSLMDNYEQAMRNFDRIAKRLNVCKAGTDKPQAKEQPKSDQTPKPSDPKTPKEPTPKPEPATNEQPKSIETNPSEPTTDDEVLVDPEPPTIPPKQVGLPYESSDCGCGKSKDLTVKSTDFSTLGTGLKNLGDCVENFKSISLTDYQGALQELSVLTDSMSNLLKTDAAAFLVKAKESKPQLDALVKRVKTYDEAGNAFLKTMEKCPESVTTGMEIFQSVEKITVESLKLKY